MLYIFGSDPSARIGAKAHAADTFNSIRVLLFVYWLCSCRSEALRDFGAFLMDTNIPVEYSLVFPVSITCMCFEPTLHCKKNDACIEAMPICGCFGCSYCCRGCICCRSTAATVGTARRVTPSIRQC
jgi:hypothetical protein